MASPLGRPVRHPHIDSVVRGRLRGYGQSSEARYVQLQPDVKNVEHTIPSKAIYWFNVFERRVVEANWGDVMEQPDFAEKFIRFTVGMAEESVRSIICILSGKRNICIAVNPSLTCLPGPSRKNCGC